MSGRHSSHEAMDTAPPPVFGRGRGVRPQHQRQPMSYSAPANRPYQRSNTSPKRPESTPDEEEARKRRLKEAEDRSGLPANIFDSMFSFASSDSLSTIVDNKPIFMPTPNSNWWTPPASEVKKEELEEKKPKVGKEYITEARQKEQARVKDLLREESEARSRSPIASSSGRPIRAEHEMSNASLMTSLSTNIESVGTYQNLEPMDTIGEGEESTDLISRYWPDNKPPLRKPLPINEYEERILKALDIHRVLIVDGKTGCGKTTQVPQYIADYCARTGKPFNIVVTQPRRIAATSIANRVAEERGWTVPSVVGFKIGMDNSGHNEDTRLLYCTTGVLLQQLIHQQKMDKYSHIIVDEVHERSIETDLLLLVIKKLMHAKELNTKIILMSATFNVDELKDYFSIDVFNDKGEVVSRVPPQIIKVKERPHKLTLFYMNDLKKNLNITFQPTRDIRCRPNLEDENAPVITHLAMDVCTQVIESFKTVDSGTHQGSVLVFLPGLEEIFDMKGLLENSREKARQYWNIIPLHSSLSLENQRKVFSPKLPNERRIILATNIAESSITVPDVSYVIDFCLTKNLVTDNDTRIPVLKTEWASRANCEQRAGRAGRVSEGRVYRLIDKGFYQSLPEYNLPELVRSPLDLSVLRVKILDMGPPKDLLGLALTPPDLADIYSSVLQLKQVGAFSVMSSRNGKVVYEDEDGDLTTLGKLMASLPIDIRLAKLICMGHVFDILEDCIIIASCLSTQGMFRRDFLGELNAYKSRLAWADRSFSDSIAYLNAYKMFKRFEQDLDNDQAKENWCRQNFVQYKRIRDVDYMFGDLMSRLLRENITIPERPNMRRNRNEEELILKVVMCAAFYPNYFTRNPIEVQNIPKMLGHKDPKDSVVINGFPANQGVLYSQAIRDLFSICSKRIDIDFEDTKAYLTFLDDVHPLQSSYENQIPEGERNKFKLERTNSELSIKSESDRYSSMSGSTITSRSSSKSLVRRNLKETTVRTAVYVAVAMRNHREVNMSLAKLQTDVAERELEKLKQKKNEEEAKRKTFSSHRLYVPHVMSRMRLSKLELPALDCSEFDIRITCVESPTLFYAQYAHSNTDEALNKLSSIIAYDITEIKCDHDTTRVGDLVIGQITTREGAKVHGRARIDNIRYKQMTKEIEEVQVYFIDYGFSHIFYDIRQLSRITPRMPPDLVRIPPQAFRCSLSEVNPSPISCHDGNWSKKSIDYFDKWTKKRPMMTAKIYSVVNRTVRLELFDVVHRAESFNDTLINIGYAEKWQESPQSQLNHDARRRQLLVRDETAGRLRLEKVDQPGVYTPDDVVELEVDFNSNDKLQNIRSHEIIRIKGPHSPLECQFTGVSRNTAFRSVRIEKNSVNCVTLEADYLSRHSRLLVACSMGLGQNSGNINLRDTTLMPNIRGFPAIMALLFAPRVQLKANKDKTHYIAAIAGLGYDRKTMKGYDPENDVEIIFDSDISLEDMVRINVIRHNISTLFESRETLREYTEGSMAIKQRKIRRNIFELLDRRRRLVDNNSYHPNYKWIECSAADINARLNTKNNRDRQLLPLCEQVQIDVDYDWYKEIEKNLDQLKLLRENKISAISECKLCRFKSYTKTEISLHCTSDQHFDAVKDFERSLKIRDQEKRKQEFFKEQEEEGIDEQINEMFDIDSDEDDIESMNE